MLYSFYQAVDSVNWFWQTRSFRNKKLHYSSSSLRVSDDYCYFFQGPSTFISNRECRYVHTACRYTGLDHTYNFRCWDEILSTVRLLCTLWNQGTTSSRGTGMAWKCKTAACIPEPQVRCCTLGQSPKYHIKGEHIMQPPKKSKSAG